MRVTLARVLATLCCTLLPLGLLSSWVAGVVTDSDRYVAAVDPLATDERVKEAVVDSVEQAAFERLDLRSARLEEAASSLVRRVVRRVVDGPRFPPAWRAANREAHQQLVAVLTDESDLVAEDGGTVSLDLDAVLAEVTERLGSQGALDPGRPVTTGLSIALIDSADLARARHGYQILDALGLWLPIAWLALLVLTLVVAPGRRRAIGWLGWGSLVSTAVLGAGLLLARPALLATSPAHDDLLGSVWDVLIAPLHVAVVAVLGAAVVVLLLRWLGLRSRWRAAGG